MMIVNVFLDDRGCLAIGDVDKGVYYTGAKMSASYLEEYSIKEDLNKKYFIFVKGGQSPSRTHTTIEEAQKERDRLATMSGTLNKEIYICEVVESHKVVPTLVNIKEEEKNV